MLGQGNRMIKVLKTTLTVSALFTSIVAIWSGALYGLYLLLRAAGCS